MLARKVIRREKLAFCDGKGFEAVGAYEGCEEAAGAMRRSILRRMLSGSGQHLTEVDDTGSIHSQGLHSCPTDGS
jgi:hypothetical protein